MTTIQKARERIKSWRENACKFVIDNFGVQPDKWQEKALKAFSSKDKDKVRIAMQACAGPGKSAALAWMGWNFLSCYGDKGEHPKGAAISITGDNLKDNLWPEFSKWQSRSEYLKNAFEWTKERLFAKQFPETWFISARSWSKTANAEEQGRTLSGLHSRFVLVLVDESGEIPLSVIKAGDQALSNCKFGKIIQAGNPTSLDGVLYAASTTLAHLWHVIRITGDPDDPDRSPRIDVEWASQQIKTYGRENPWVMSYILGLFPPSSINALIGPDEVAAAMKRHLRVDEYDWAQKRIGVDAARFGDDPWCIFPRQGLASFTPIIMRNPRTHDVLGRLMAKEADWAKDGNDDIKCFVDGTGGFGSGVVDGLLQSGRNPIEVQYSSKPIDPRYFNKRSEILWEVIEWIKRGGALPPDPELAKELTTPTYWFERGKLRVEEKEQIKKRLGFSPNKFDALACTFAMPDRPRSIAGHSTHRQQKASQPYDPFGDLESLVRDDSGRGRTPM